MRMGGLGLRSAERCAHAAYWASWAHALHMIAQRNPAEAEMVVQSMSDDINPGEGSLAELKMATDRLDRQGFWWRPSWSELQEGRRLETHTEPGEWQHGWQYWSSTVTDSHFRKMTMLSGRTAARRAHLRSHSGRNAGAALAGCPTCPDPSTSVQNNDPGEALFAIADDRGALRRVSRPARHLGTSPSLLCEKWQSEDGATRAHHWPHIPGSRCDCQTGRLSEGYER